MTVDVQDTPNPRAKRFLLDQPVQQDLIGRSFSPGDPIDDQLISTLLAIPAVASLLTLPSSITINVESEDGWPEVQARALEALHARFS